MSRIKTGASLGPALLGLMLASVAAIQTAEDTEGTIQSFGRNGLHQPWRSTACEIHPVMKVEVIR